MEFTSRRCSTVARNFAGDFPRGFTSLVASLMIVSQLCCGLSFQLRTGLVPHGVMRVRAAELELRRPHVNVAADLSSRGRGA